MTNVALSSFNRYIVECKLTSNLIILYHFAGFNRYIVECKLGTEAVFSALSPVLIDT